MPTQHSVTADAERLQPGIDDWRASVPARALIQGKLRRRVPERGHDQIEVIQRDKTLIKRGLNRRGDRPHANEGQLHGECLLHGDRFALAPVRLAQDMPVGVLWRQDVVVDKRERADASPRERKRHAPAD